MPKLRILLLSSTESTQRLKTLHARLTEESWISAKIWQDVVSRPGRTVLQCLAEIERDFDCVLLFMDGTDISNVRGEHWLAPRDNLLFEAGFCIARFGTDRTFLLVPRGMNVKLPSELIGVNVTEYVADEEMRATSTTVTTRLKPLRNIPRSHDEPPDSHEAPPDLHIVPIYRTVNVATDWFRQFGLEMQRQSPYLDSSMLYYGPGLARHWFEIANRARSAWEQHLWNSFTARMQSIVMKSVPAEDLERLTVVDLGSGDFEKGERVLEYVTGQHTEVPVSYFAVDISYEMLHIGLESRTQIVMRVRGSNGEVVGINARFADLASYRTMLGTSRKLFLMLGNTLGNEASELSTLEGPRRTMREDDVLILELQMAEEIPFSGDELTHQFQTSKHFYGGPFVALGARHDQFDFFIRRDDARSEYALTYQYFIRPHDSMYVRHPGFGQLESVRVPADDIGVYVVRKYRDTEAIENMLARARFEIIETDYPRPAGRERRFCYVSARPMRAR